MIRQKGNKNQHECSKYYHAFGKIYLQSFLPEWRKVFGKSHLLTEPFAVLGLSMVKGWNQTAGTQVGPIMYLREISWCYAEFVCLLDTLGDTEKPCKFLVTKAWEVPWPPHSGDLSHFAGVSGRWHHPSILQWFILIYTFWYSQIPCPPCVVSAKV